eukprot:scaffold76823_cov17-Tisochrysis_lutea.AAC.2
MGLACPSSISLDSFSIPGKKDHPISDLCCPEIASYAPVMGILMDAGPHLDTIVHPWRLGSTP